VRETRRGRGYAKSDDGSIEMHVDFEGGTLGRLPATADVNVTLWTDANGEVVERHVRRNEVTGGWRAVVRFRRVDRSRALELRATLTQGNEVLTETWSYILPAE